MVDEGLREVLEQVAYQAVDDGVSLKDLLAALSDEYKAVKSEL